MYSEGLMAYLNWKNESLVLSQMDASAQGILLKLELKPEQAAPLKELLLEVAQGTSRELRVDLTNGWTVFWKLRADETNKLLLAHPEVDQWVATVALSQQGYEHCLQSLCGATPCSFQLSQIGGAAPGNNFDLSLSIQ
jgi:hypothetical protein